eukprot:m.35506 g.35506  ORF g.35506 m.35506 type:complete len:57 (+) comp7450_c0_seq1:4627-4797(+)
MEDSTVKLKGFVTSSDSLVKRKRSEVNFTLKRCSADTEILGPSSTSTHRPTGVYFR